MTVSVGFTILLLTLANGAAHREEGEEAAVADANPS